MQHELYWIHLEEHTDITKEGYIGVTKHTTAVRFKGHKSNYQRHLKDTSRNNHVILYRAFDKYGVDNVIVTTLCIGSEDYIYNLENKLRSHAGTGWNCAVGGATGRHCSIPHEDVFEAVKMYYEENLSATEVSERLGINEHTTRKIVTGGKRLEVLEDYLKSEGLPSDYRRDPTPSGSQKLDDNTVYAILDRYYNKNDNTAKICQEYSVNVAYIESLVSNRSRPELVADFRKNNPSAYRVDANRFTKVQHFLEILSSGITPEAAIKQSSSDNRSCKRWLTKLDQLMSENSLQGYSEINTNMLKTLIR